MMKNSKTVKAHFSNEDDEISYDAVDPINTALDRDEEILTVENAVSEGDHNANNGILDPSNSDSLESHGSFAQNYYSNQSLMRA